MSSGRILGLDPGERRVGVALSDPGRIIASPYTVLDARTDDVEESISAICDEYEIETIVVGLPVSLSGTEGISAEAARAFGDRVQSVTGRNLVYWDERFTSVQAENALLEGRVRRDKRRVSRDMIAASLMLQGYLDATGAEPS